MTTARLTAASFGLAYVAVLVALVVLDAIWLGVLSKELYRREMGSLMAESFRLGPAVLFYLLYPLALVYLVLWHPPSGALDAISRSAVLGLAAYGAYNLTNLAIIRGWPLQLSLIDWAWGGFVTALAGGAGWWAAWGRSV
ncbi:MAG: DUF2177 family protein [Caldimonas sp.]